MAKKNEYSNYYMPFMQPVPMDFDMLFKHYFNFIIRDIFQIFDFNGLPETIDETFLKYCIFLNGKVVFFNLDDGTLVALNGNYSDDPNLYYIPKMMIVTNPVLKRSYQMKIGEECIVVYCSETDVYNQFQFGGLYTLISRTATMLADGDLSINVAQKNKRLVNVLAAEDQKTKDAIDVVVRKQYAGEPYVVVMKSLIDNIESVPITEKTIGNDIIQLIQSHQYILAHFYESLGLQTHDNMKKERLITAEVNDNDGVAKLNIDNILNTIQAGIDKVNKKYGTNITVRLNSILLEKTEPEETDDSQTNEDPTEQKQLKESQAVEPEEPDDSQTNEEPPEEPDSSQTDEEPEEVDTNAEPAPEEEPKIEIEVTAEDNADVEINIDTGGVDDGNDNPV